MDSLDELIGKPFQEFGRGPDAYDCYGLVIEAGRCIGVEVPDYGSLASHCIRAIGRRTWRLLPLFEQTEPRRGAIVAMWRHVPKMIDHLGMMVDDWSFIHSTRENGAICTHRGHHYWCSHIKGFYRWKGTSGS